LNDHLEAINPFWKFFAYHLEIHNEEQTNNFTFRKVSKLSTCRE